MSRQRHFVVLGAVLVLGSVALGRARHDGSAPGEPPPPLGVRAAAPPATLSYAVAEERYGKLPLYFIENRGQTDRRVAYYVQGSDKTLFFTAHGVTFAIIGPNRTSGSVRPGPPRSAMHKVEVTWDSWRSSRRWALQLDFVGANRQAGPQGEEVTPAIVSHFVGRRDQWHTGLKTYARVVYRDLWPGIDLEYRGTANELKYQFVVQPGANPTQIRLAYRGATQVEVDSAGRLAVRTPVGTLTDEKPYAYQVLDGQQMEVTAAYELPNSALRSAPPGAPLPDTAHAYTFRVGAYDRSRPLVIDPTMILYAGFIGGSGDDVGSGIAVDRAGNAYVTGSTFAELSLPASVGPDTTHNGHWDAFVAKVKADGSGLIYAGYIGGSGWDEGKDIAIDSDGAAYVTGKTDSKGSSRASFPVTGGPDTSYNGGRSDAFVAKVRPDGSGLVYAGYIGGSDEDVGYGIAVDSAGAAYITGGAGERLISRSLVGPDTRFNGGSWDAFVAKVKVDGSGLVYAGYIGGSGFDSGDDIGVDSAGAAYVTGQTDSTESSPTPFPVRVGPDTTYNGGERDAFVAKVKPDGTSLVYAGYIGGFDDDRGWGIAVDSGGAAYVTGGADAQLSLPFQEVFVPALLGPDTSYNGGGADAFVVKVKPDGEGFVYAGYIGGGGADSGGGIAVDSAGNAYVTGYTASAERSAMPFPVSGGPDTSYNGGGDAFVAKVKADGTSFIYAGYIGGSAIETSQGIAVDSSGAAYLTGSTRSTESSPTPFPVSAGPDTSHNGGSDAFVVKIAPTR